MPAKKAAPAKKTASKTTVPKKPAARARRSVVERNTKETQIRIELALDGEGAHEISTGIPFFDHMLTQIARHGLFDLIVKAKGDIEIDFHHTVEDTAICLGQAFKEAVGDGKGIRRYGFSSLPMIETLANVALDFSNRPHFVFNVPLRTHKLGDFDTELCEEFFRAFASNAGLDLHVNVPYGTNSHHMIEAVFKATAKSLDSATQLDPRVKGVPSTKGTL